jgi:hypothetical protein
LPLWHVAADLWRDGGTERGVKASMRLMLLFGNVSDVVEMGAIAQRRRKGDRHELNALRTWVSAVRPPEPPIPSYFPQP